MSPCLVVLRPLPICAGQLLPRIQHPHRVLNARDPARVLHRTMDVLVDLAAGFIVGRDNKRILRLAHVLAGYLADALVAVHDLMHPALAVEIGDGFFHFAARKLLHGNLSAPGLSAG